jgi:hypothetical protein
MVGASRLRRVRLLGGLFLAVSVLALSAQPAQADTRVIKGGESRLEVNIANFVKMLGDGIFATAIEPARLEFGARPAAIFPASNVGVFDPVLTVGAVHHQGGLRLAKDSINFAIDVTNPTLTCTTSLVEPKCRILATANGVLPNELAELHNATVTDNMTGTVTVQGRALVGPVAATVLNTLFQTQIFTAGMELGVWTSTINYDPLPQL